MAGVTSAEKKCCDSSLFPINSSLKEQAGKVFSRDMKISIKKQKLKPNCLGKVSFQFCFLFLLFWGFCFFVWGFLFGLLLLLLLLGFFLNFLFLYFGSPSPLFYNRQLHGKSV